MPAAEDARGIFRPCVMPEACGGKAPDAADAHCIGKFGVTPEACLRHDAAGAEKHRAADPSGISKRSLERDLLTLKRILRA